MIVGQWNFLLCDTPNWRIDIIEGLLIQPGSHFSADTVRSPSLLGNHGAIGFLEGLYYRAHIQRTQRPEIDDFHVDS